jgi:hypothetical protein
MLPDVCLLSFSLRYVDKWYRPANCFFLFTETAAVDFAVLSYIKKANISSWKIANLIMLFELPSTRYMTKSVPYDDMI